MAVEMEDGRKLIYSERDVVCEETDDNITRYIRGNGKIVASDSENTRTYCHYACDSLGSITHVIAGNEFGNIVNTEETIANRYGFAGEIHDCITDIYYLRARYYAPDMGRFTQADTYHGDGLNLYVYAGNNPVKYVDPSGHSYKNNDVKGGINSELVNIDTGTAHAFVSQDSSIRHELKVHVQGKKMVMTETAVSEFKTAVSGAGGPLEQARAERFLNRVKIIPDSPSERAMNLKNTKKIQFNDKVIFGTGDNLEIETMTSDAKFIRGAEVQGVKFKAYVHQPQPLMGK